MTTFAIDNTPVSVTLSDNETYSPASGSVQKLKIACPEVEFFRINGSTIIDGNGPPPEITVILTDSDQIKGGNNSVSRGVHVSGFEVN